MRLGTCVLVWLTGVGSIAASVPRRVKELAADSVTAIPANCARNNPQVANGTLIDQLWRRNCDVIEHFLNNGFSVSQAAGNENETQLLESFQYYQVQDYYYLLETIKLKGLVMRSYRAKSSAELIAFVNNTVKSMQGNIEYASEFRQDLKKISIPDDVIERGTLQEAGSAYLTWLQDTSTMGRYALQVARVACIYGWAELANNLNTRTTTNKNTSFDEYWIQPNLEWSYGADISRELEDGLSINNNTDTFEIYNSLFRQGFYFETLFFTNAIGKSLNDI